MSPCGGDILRSCVMREEVQYKGGTASLSPPPARDRFFFLNSMLRTDTDNRSKGSLAFNLVLLFRKSLGCF